MRKLLKPNITQKEIVESCISNMEDVSLVELIKSSIEKFDESYRIYNEHSMQNNLHLFEEGYTIAGIDASILKKLYTDKLSKKGQPAREYYKKLMDLSLDSMCTACGYRPADTLDHVLAKTNFPAFSINPLNLVPMCLPCNKKKSNKKSDSKLSNTLHPYYDDVDTMFWLKARLKEELPFEINFYVARPSECDEETYERIKVHFDMFSLNQLYEIYVGTEITTQIYDLKELFDEYGRDILKEELDRIKKKYSRGYKNTWQFAFYEELSSNEWFLSEMLKNDINTILK